MWKTSDRHNLKSNCTSYSTLLPGHTRANHRPGCWKQLPLPVPHCWQYRRRLESIATVRIMIADPSLEVCVPRHPSRLWGRSTAVTAVSSRQNRDAPAETLLGLRQGQLYVAGDSDILLSRSSRGEGLFCPSIYIIAIKSQIVQKNQKNFYNFYYKPPKAIKFCYNKAKYSMMIKCLLKRHRYPPEGMDDAVQTVMTQCELWTDNNDMESA